MKPYLKGFHLTLHSWCLERDEAGWKMANPEQVLDKEELLDEEAYCEATCQNTSEPDLVKPVSRMIGDLHALHNLTESLTPPLRLVRPNTVREVCYGFGDASGAGFGSTFTSPGAVVYRYGTWGHNEDSLSSSWRE
jgi:hypothetical protein